MVEPLLKDIKIEDALMDGAYDKKSVFTYLRKKGVIKPGVKTRKNAVANDDSDRSESVLEMKSWDTIAGRKSMAMGDFPKGYDKGLGGE